MTFSSCSVAKKVDQELPYCQNLTDCVLKIGDDINNCDTRCELPPCSEVVYDAISSFQRLEPPPGDDKPSEDFIDLVINYEAMRQKRVTESIATTTAQLLSSIGGTMGLWLGVSVVSLVEVFGELLSFRLVPRLLWQDSRLHGVGSYN